jgi:DNA-directed RNA polymerase subunit beta
VTPRPEAPDNLLGDRGGSLIATPPPAPPALREFGDAGATRKAIYDGVFDAASKLEPLENDRHLLRLSGVRWQDPDHFTTRQRKQALLTGGTLARRLRGTWELVDKATDKVLDRREQVIARVPHLTDMGTFVFNGNDNTLTLQQRLKPGAFVRRKDNGELEAHANVLPGKGVSHRYLLDPDKGVFKIKVAQAEMPLLPLLKAMNAGDDELRDAWGQPLFAANVQKSEAGVINKLAQRVLRKADREHPDESYRRQKVAETFANMEVDPEVMKRTLGIDARGMNKEAILATTRKLLAVSRGEAEVDDRDHLAYQTFHGPEDLFAERIRRDHGKRRRQLFWKASLKGSLKDFPSGALTPQLEQAIIGSGLGQAVEEINPAEVFDKQTRITRMGEGGIPSLEAIPDEARGVQPSHMGFLDPLRTPESFRVGVDLHVSRNARKGSDNKLYARFRNARTGEMEWKSPSDIADEPVAFPGYQKATTKRVPVMKAGKITYVPRDEVAYELPHFEDAFSPLGNLVPLKSMVKGGRVAMGSRYLTQALPLIKGEAPFVQGAVPGTEGRQSFEELYGRHLGAVHAEKAGRVMAVDRDSIELRHDDGTVRKTELYDNMPFNRKTYIHHTPVVKPGDVVGPGQLLARSNYNDDKGRVALGMNMRVAYLPWKGLNFEDAVAISEGAAGRLSSEHMYHHDVQVDERSRMGKNNFIQLFPGRFDRKTLGTLDERGVVREGARVEYGQPLILAARERDRSESRVHKKGQAGFSDDTVIWKHHDPGVVTDVVHGKGGPVVLVKSASAMQVGDKLTGRYGDKGVVAAIIPDHRMPHDQGGKPYEVLLNPLGVISRTNPAQMVEAMLGKVAELTGEPVKVRDFDDVEDMTEWAEQTLRKHGIKDVEDVVDPDNQNKIKGVATGNRWFMKLHHTAECFDDRTEALTARGWVPWPQVRDDDELASVEDDRLIYERPIEVIRFPFRGDLYCYRGRYLDYAVTGNHRLYGRYYHRRSETDRFEPACRVHGRRFRVRQFGLLPDRLACADRFVVGDVSLSWDDYGELVGWWASEGYARCTHRRACVLLYQSRDAHPEHFARIEALAARIGLPWHYYRSRGKCLGIGISSRPLAAYLKSHGAHAYDKRLPREALSAPLSARRAIFEAMMRGDGNRQHTRSGPRERYVTTSGQLADDFQELCVRIGLGAVVRPTKLREEQEIDLPDGRRYVSKCRQAWECGVALSRTFAQVDSDRNPDGFSKRPYDGLVYCAEMRTGLLYVRRNGKPMLSGNSKGQGRGGGGYGLDEAPSKGGETGCFTPDAMVELPRARPGRRARYQRIGRMAGRHYDGPVCSNDPETFAPTSGRVTHWFAYEVDSAELVELVLAGGGRIRCTRGHVFVLADGTRKPAGELRPGDDLMEA